MDTGYSQEVVALDRAGAIYKLKRNRRGWKVIRGRLKLKHASAGETGLWAVSRSSYIYYRVGKSTFTLDNT